MTAANRSCPLCEGKASSPSFPYALRFNDQIFRFFCCGECLTVFVDPVPNAACFALMYGKENYHDAHYGANDLTIYRQAAVLLRRFAQPGSTVLDYGCGVGHFLQAVKAEGFAPYGVEFDASAAASAAVHAGCRVATVADLDHAYAGQLFDVIHFGDVLEHLPDPAATLTGLLTRLKPRGLLFVEGPLETNPSPVYWAARLFGDLKHRLRPTEIGAGVPTHLFRTSAPAQARFFRQRFPSLKPLVWQVTESGWPYAQGNWIKRGVAAAAITLGGRKLAGIQLGNRFQALYSYQHSDLMRSL
jgi:SAM-dependent methyltransferase